MASNYLFGGWSRQLARRRGRANTPSNCKVACDDHVGHDPREGRGQSAEMGISNRWMEMCVLLTTGTKLAIGGGGDFAFNAKC